ncbi:cryptochrome/photolyase family protein [Allosphingosinicella indica]|uniref:Deoxyribodipyrimidine photo-lyase n=1 Tax=Allosphingosinicella indica TaxID=941907 RepID=A0A1X7GN26_9SPHN|nr:deoxyribodipyrimidine photo-lyase [Allosphingosinicella indica]SMF72058.1 deoxyribodipyrimidine photo-lyase [Allosphingosinicella indica]
MTAPPVIVWFRQDLRLADQAALAAAAAEGPVIPFYVLDDETPGKWRIGGAQRWWLYHSLQALDASLGRHRSRLILRSGKAAEVVAAVAKEVGATRVHAIRHYEPWWREAEDALGKAVDLCLHDGNQLAPPGAVRTGSGGIFKIFTPFWRALQEHMPPPAPAEVPSLSAPSRWPKSERLEEWALLPEKPDWAEAFDTEWTPGEAGAAERLEDFVAEVARYKARRDLPAEEGTSRLSPHLHFGEISPATVWHRLSRAKGAEFLRELAWRDFAQNELLILPELGEANAREAFDRFPWRSGKAAASDLRAWQQGRTGYPIVDAGMRQLWATGWMHNRVRMIAASFLIKHLLIDWRDGAAWFWDTLVDADWGNNSLNWQWVAGSGFDSNPFGRIMAPLSQSEKFDAGDYIRAWVPELGEVDDAAIHDPHGVGAAPEGYPEPLIGHKEARARALSAVAKIKSAR